MSHDRLVEDIAHLRASGVTIDIHEDDKQYYVIVRQ